LQRSIKLPSDLLIMLIWTILTLVFVIVPSLSDTFLRTLLGIPIVLFIPGYVLIAVLFPKKDDLESIERMALSFGLSIALVPLLGLLLNFTFGIKILPILFTLCFYIIVLILIAIHRREKLPPEERFYVPYYHVYESIYNEMKTNRGKPELILIGVLIFSIAMVTGMIFFIAATPKIGDRFTEFYILGPEGKAENYSLILKYQNPVTVPVGVVNHEHAPVNYTVQVALDGQVITDTWLRLNNSETWEKNITFAPDKEGTGIKLEFWLFKEDNFTSPYRELYLWVNVTK
jgi:uncharacterized membrane protein